MAKGPLAKPRFDRTTGRWYVRIGGRKHYGPTEADAWRLYDTHTARHRAEPDAIVEAIAQWATLKPDPWLRRIAAHWAEYVGAGRIRHLRPNSLEQYLAHLERRSLAPATMKHCLNVAYRVCRWIVDNGWLTREPRKPKPPKAIEADRDLSHDLLTRVFQHLDASPRRHRAARVLRFCLFTGCRPKEARLLRWEQLRWAEGEYGCCILPCHKTQHTGRQRVIALTLEARDLLESLPNRAPGGWVFPSSRGEPYTKDGLRSVLRRAADSLGQRCTPYQLRHTAAQDWLEQGVPIDVLAGLLGHSDRSGLAMVQRYAKTRQRRLNRAAAGLVSPLQRSPQPDGPQRAPAGGGVGAAPETLPRKPPPPANGSAA